MGGVWEKVGYLSILQSIPNKLKQMLRIGPLSRMRLFKWHIVISRFAAHVCKTIPNWLLWTGLHKMYNLYIFLLNTNYWKFNIDLIQIYNFHTIAAVVVTMLNCFCYIYKNICSHYKYITHKGICYCLLCRNPEGQM